MDNAKITVPIKEMERRFKSVMVRMPAIAGNEVVNFALDNFKRQAWMGDTIQPWRKRKNPTKWGKAPKRNGRAVLVDSGRLRRSIRVVNSTWDSVTVGSDVPYASAHNDGLRIGEIQKVKSFQRKMSKVKGVKRAAGTVTVKAHTRRINQNIPQRQFLGNSQYLNKRLQRVAGAEILKVTK